MFTNSRIVNNRYIVGAKKIIQRLSNKSLDILPCLCLNEPKTSLEIGVQVRADMRLSFSARRFVAAYR